LVGCTWRAAGGPVCLPQGAHIGTPLQDRIIARRTRKNGNYCTGLRNNRAEHFGEFSRGSGGLRSVIFESGTFLVRISETLWGGQGERMFGKGAVGVARGEDRAMAGRPTVVSMGLVATLAEHVREGTYAWVAAEAAGISYSTPMFWPSM
jgi:hypothetical protein